MDQVNSRSSLPHLRFSTEKGDEDDDDDEGEGHEGGEEVKQMEDGKRGGGQTDYGSEDNGEGQDLGVEGEGSSGELHPGR